MQISKNLVFTHPDRIKRWEEQTAVDIIIKSIPMQKLNELLKTCAVTIYYRALDGNESYKRVTQAPWLIPAHTPGKSKHHSATVGGVTFTPADSTRVLPEQHDDTVLVWSLDNSGWRRLKRDGILRIVCVDND